MNKKTVVLTCIFFCWIACFSANSQETRGIGGTVAGTETQSQKWAVIIGVGQYQDKGIGALPNAVNDARAVQQALTSAADGFPEANVVLLTTGESAERHPTRANILRYLRSYLSLAGPDDTVMVYFAGHGVSESGKLYLLPSDTTTAALSESGYSYSLMEQQLEESKAKKKIVILDACHSGSGRGTDTMSPEIISEIERSSQGIVTLASCSAQEKSHEMPQSGHGTFTYFLLKGMEGEADRDGNGLITASELSLYTWDATRRWAAQQGLMQTPWRLEKVAGDIVLTKSDGRTAQSPDNLGSVEDRAPVSRKVADLDCYTESLDDNAAVSRGFKSNKGALIVGGASIEKVGLEYGDFIVRIDSQEISDATKFVQVIRSKPAKSKITMVVIRNGIEKIIEVPLGERSSCKANSEYWVDKGIAEKEISRANEYFTKAVEEDVDCWHAYYYRGCSFVELRRYEEAINDFSRAIELEQKDYCLYLNRGVVYFALSKFKEALRDSSRAIELDQKQPLAYTLRGAVYASLRNYNEGIHDYTKAIEIDPKMAVNYSNRGDIYYGLGKYVEAIHDYTIAIEIDPKNAIFYNNRGNSYHSLKKYNEAIRDYSEAIEFDPTLSIAFHNRANCYKIQKLKQLASVDFNMYLKLTGGKLEDADDIRKTIRRLGFKPEY